MLPDSVAQNLLFGILALQNQFIDRQQLIAAFDEWTTDKSRRLGEILVTRDAIDAESHALLQSLVRQHLKRHHNDVEQSLAAVSSIGSVREELHRLRDSDVDTTLAHVARNTTAHLKGPETPHDDATTVGLGSPVANATRFRILRPHARGGLGEVFVAHDEELNREVALKEIQLRHADNPHSRARFLVEAEVTGGLEHPGVVPVYGLGTYADGRPFYAMRFIKGESLKEGIEQFHKMHSSDRRTTRSRRFYSVDFRELLGRFVDVCNAIQYAHSRGVLHRDLKPGNIMLGQYGETLVVDWGLAKVVGRREIVERAELTLRLSSGSGSTDTESGQALGTPAFMSPEQAAGELEQLGPRSDVYSLGATLYCMLTGKNPFVPRSPDDSEGIIARVKLGDFEPPRSVTHDVPHPLNAICMKAMALHPENRYATPREVANDMKHWLAGEPVSAWREPILEQTRRWILRHRTLVTTITGSMLVAIATFSILAVRHNWQMSQANAQLETANNQSQQNFRDAAESLFELMSVAEVLPSVGVDDARVELFRHIEKKVQRLALAQNDRLESIKTSAALLRGLGFHHSDLRDFGNAESALSEAVQKYTTLSEREPNTLDHRVQLAECLVQLGYVHHIAGRADEAKTSFERALGLLSGRDLKDPEHCRVLASAHLYFGNYLWGHGQHVLAEKEADDAIRLLESLGPNVTRQFPIQRDQAGSYDLLGISLYAQGNFATAFDQHKKAENIYQSLLDRKNTSMRETVDAREALAGTMAHEANCLRPLGRIDEMGQALDLRYKSHVELYKWRPTPDYLAGMLETSVTTADLLQERGQNAAAKQFLVDRMTAFTQAHETFDSHRQCARTVADMHVIMGRALTELGEADAEQNFEAAARLYRRLADATADNADYLASLAVCHGDWGYSAHTLKKPKEAQSHFDTAIQQITDIRKKYPDNLTFMDVLATMHARSGDLLLETGPAAKARSEFHSALALRRKIVEKSPEANLFAYRLALMLAHCPDAEVRDSNEAVKILERARDQLPAVELPGYLVLLSSAHYRSGQSKVSATMLESLTCPESDASFAIRLLVLAMANVQLEKLDLARMNLDVGREWVHQYAPQNRFLRNFVEEAERAVSGAKAL